MLRARRRVGQDFVPPGKPVVHGILEDGSSGTRASALAVDHAHAADSPLDAFEHKVLELESGPRAIQSMQVYFGLDAESAIPQITQYLTRNVWPVKFDFAARGLVPVAAQAVLDDR